MKTTLILLTIAISLIIIPIHLSEPSFNGSSPGCSGSGCHTFSDGDVSVTILDSMNIEVIVSGTTNKVGGELVDEGGNVVDVINSTSNNPFILTAPAPGNYIVNAGYKNPSKMWDSAMVVINPAQTTHDVIVTNFSFIPEILNITIGDTVRWTNVLGTHNVVADDNSFTSGPVAPPTWEYTYVFTTTSNNPYYCVLHGGPGGLGMSGVINVLPSTTFPLAVTVADGWNMVSAPGLHPTNQNVDTWWSGKDPAADVFKYSAGYLSVTTTTPTEQQHQQKDTG